MPQERRGWAQALMRWIAIASALALTALLFMLTSPADQPSTTTLPEAIPSPTSPTPTTTEPPVAEEPLPRRFASFLINGFLVGALPDGTRYSVRLDPVRNEEVTGISAAIMVDLEDGAVPAGVVTFQVDDSVEAVPGGSGSLIYTFSGPTSVTVTLYEEVREALGVQADQLFIDAFSGGLEDGYPVLRLEPPLRWATDYEIPIPMEVAFETFAVRRGCDEIAVACSSRGGVQVIPLDRLRRIAPVWDDAWAFVASQAPRPEWHPSYFPPGPLDPRALPDVLWTGSEMIVWGGIVQGEPRGKLVGLIEGAAYDPATGEWRMLAPAPLSEGADSRAVWADGRMIVVSSEATLAYEPETDTWTEIASGRLASMSPGRMVWTGEAIYLWDSGDLSRLDVGSGTWKLLPRPPLVEEYDYLTELRVFRGKLLAVGVSGPCEGLDLTLWDGSEWQALPPVLDLGGSVVTDCVSPMLVAVVGDTILVWYDRFGSATFSAGDSAWVDAGPPALHGEGRPSGALVLGDRVLVPQDGQAALYDPIADTWTRVLLPGWGASWDMVWTGREVLKWGMTQCCLAEAPLDAWRWRPPER